jgi:uncharacterized protein
MLGLSRVRIETDVLGLLPSSVPGVPELRRLNAQLADQRTLILLLEPAQKDASLEEAVTEALCADLRQVQGTLSVRDAFSPPAVDQCFSALVSYLTLNQSAAVFTKQWAALSGDALDKKLTTAMNTLSSSLDAMAVTHAGYDPLGLTEHSVFQWQEASLAKMADADGSAQVLMIEASPELTGYKAYADWIQKLRDVLAKHTQLQGSFTGPPAFAAEIGSAMEQDMGGTAGICGLLVVLLFLGFQRSLKQLTAIFACIVLTLLTALGVYGWWYGELGVVSAGFAAILMGLIVDYAMIVGREVHATGSVEQGQAHSARGIFWGSLTTAAPFAVLMSSVLPGGNQLGFLVTVGLLVGAAVMVGFYPRWAFSSKVARQPLVLPLVPLRSQLAWVCFTLLFSAALLGIWQFRDRLKLSFDMKTLNPVDSRALATLERLQELFPSWDEGLVHMVVEQGAKVDLAALEKRLLQLKEEGQVTDWLLPTGLLPSETDFVANLRTVVESKLWLTEVKAKLAEKGFADQASALAQALTTQAEQWSGSSAAKAFDQVRHHALLTSVVLAPYAKFPSAAVGALRLAQLPSAAMHEKIRALDQTGVRVASWPMLQYDMEPLLARDATRTLLPMIGVLALALLVALKSLRDAMVAIALLMLSLAWVLLLVLWQSKSGPHFLHILGLVLLMGAGLDYMLHMIFALRREQGAAAPVMASTGMAVIFCALSTAIGFGSLIFATNHAMADLGLISAAGVLFVLCLALFLLPGMLRRSGA